MAAEPRVPWSLWTAALWGCAISAFLLVRHLMGEVEPYPSQTVAGQIAYWVGFLGAPPLLFVLIAAVRNSFTPKATPAPTPTPATVAMPQTANDDHPRSALANFFWPNRIKPEPKGAARFGRVLHWLFAAGALAFVIGGMYAIFFYGDANSGMALIAFGGGFCFFAGRAVRYVFAGE